MTTEEFLHRTRAVVREYNRAQRILFAAVGIVMAAGLVVTLHPRWGEKNLPAWMSFVWLTVFLGLLVFAAVFQGANTRRLNRRHGLCCPECGKSLTGSAALAALSYGTCEVCGTRMIDPPWSSAPSPAPPPPEAENAASFPSAPCALLNRREFPAKLAQTAVSPLGLWWMQLVLVMPGVMLFNHWSLHGLSNAAFTVRLTALLTVFALLLRFHWRRLRARHVRLGLCCPQCREPLHPMERALETLATCHCTRCGAAVFPPGPE